MTCIARLVRRLGVLLLSISLLLASPPDASAVEQLLAITGDAVPGLPAAAFAGFSEPVLNASGQVAFSAVMQAGLGGVTASDNRNVWRYSGDGMQMVARTGSTAPSGGAFKPFLQVSLNDAGAVAFNGEATTADLGIWRFEAGSMTGSTIVLTGAAPSADLPTARMEAIQSPLLQSPGGRVAFDGKLALGLGGVSSSTDNGVWLSTTGQNLLLAREGITHVPGFPGDQFNDVGAKAVNNQGQVASFASLKMDGILVNSTNNQGIWRLQSSGGELIARSGVGDVPDLPGAKFSAFLEQQPMINSVGQIAFAADLAPIGGVSEANNRGVWLYDEPGSGKLIARSGSTAPGADAAAFQQFFTPLLNDAGQLLLPALLTPGVGGATEANSSGLWLMESGGGSLVARTDSGGVPGVPGASFASLDYFALNENGLVAMQATLAVGTGGVTAANNQGLWLLNGAGEGTLIARKGQVIAGRTISSLTFADGSGGGDGWQRSLNSSGQLVYKATFTNGHEGILLHSPDGGDRAGDFDGDGDVDGNDLTDWKNNFGLALGAGKSQGNADGDGDVDGADFLLWQQQFTGGAATSAIPEPKARLLLASAAALMSVVADRHSGAFV